MTNILPQSGTPTCVPPNAPVPDPAPAHLSALALQMMVPPAEVTQPGGALLIQRAKVDLNRPTTACV